MRESFFQSNENFVILGGKNVAILKANNQIFTFGDKSSDRAQSISKALKPYFSNAETFSIEEKEAAIEYSGKNFKLQKFSDNLARGIFAGEKIFFVGDFTKEEVTNLKSQKIAFDSDFWILKTSKFPDFLPKPKVAILHLGERKFSKKLKTFARERKIPVLSVSDTEGFLLEKEEEWSLKTR
ncbi:MAG: hypothetical protein OEL89_04735 [Candidatus Peregrinibacteria bacterium]|nr:hypothetical protein [Candidatus Peregrinibacteria bacterium]